MLDFDALQRYTCNDALLAKAKSMRETHLRELFAEDDQRFDRFSREFETLLWDFSKSHVDDEVLDLLARLAEEAQLSSGIEQLFSGAQVNTTEQRSALHMALRAKSDTFVTADGERTLSLVNAQLDKMAQFVDKVRTKKWLGHTGKPIDTIVNIGIGGSDLGPKLVCQALSSYSRDSLAVKFISSIDANHIYPILTSCDPETTLFIVASKSFGTEETLTNATTARDWLLSSMDNDFSAVAKHFVAVSTNKAKVSAFGMDTQNMFGFWDWVGGRYSVWSVIGLPVALYIGMERFLQFLAGAEAMDKHFREQPLRENIPMLLGLLGVWQQNYMQFRTHAILPYDDYLRYFPDYLQQLEMESNGKSVDKAGYPVAHNTCPVIWGGLGNNGQHAFYQLLHQGTRRVFQEFFAPVSATNPIGEHHERLLANCLAQSEALMMGLTDVEARAAMQTQGLSADDIDRLAPYRAFPGNRPSHTFLYQSLTPRVLGSLIAMYEHKVFVQGWIWDINSFDQWGVELGKKLAKRLKSAITGAQTIDDLNPSTQGLISYLHQHGQSSSLV